MWPSAAVSEVGCVFPDRVRSIPEYLAHCLPFLSISYTLSVLHRGLPGASVADRFSPMLSEVKVMGVHGWSCGTCKMEPV